MRYFANYDENGTLLAIGKGSSGVEISEAEFNRLREIIVQKATLVDSLFYGEITIEDVPEAWKEEIQKRVNERIANEESSDEQEVSSDEFYSMILEVL